MSAAALSRRSEPGRIPAFILAAAVHAGFVAVLIFGVSWQTRQPTPLTAELWSALPVQPAPEPPAPAPPPEEPKPEPKVEPPRPEPVKVEPPKPAPADIELKKKQEKEKKLKQEREEAEKLEKKKREAEKKEAEEKKRKDEEKRKADDKRKADEKRQAEDKARKAAEAKARADAEAAARAAASAQQKKIDDWANQIRALIRNKANVPETVVGNPVIQVRVKLLVTGAVFEVVVTKPSGNRVYDDSVERAIAGIRQWPTPSDPDIFRNNREITLNIKHER